MENNYDAAIEELKAKYRENSPPETGPTGAPDPNAGPPNEPPLGVDISPDEAERLFANFIEYPYELLNKSFNTDEFTLSPAEKSINGLLIKFTVLHYLPRLDLGKWSIWIFLAFNGLLIFGKYNIYKEKVKAQKTAPDSPAQQGATQAADVGVKPTEKTGSASAEIKNKDASRMSGIIAQGIAIKPA